MFPWDRFLARYAALVHDLLGMPGPNTEEFTMDAEARQAFATLQEQINDLRAGQLVHIDENRKQYGSLRGWIAATAEAVGKLLSPVKALKAMRQRAGELDTHTHPDA